MVIYPRSSAMKAALIIANLLIPISVIVFSTGFFPYKPFIPGLATFDESQNGVKPPAIFDRVIFMVVDALRSDFVYGEDSGFEFTQRSGAALPFTAYATAPTITMPRIKAITTGSVPSFLDVILNFAESDTSSTLAQQDTWLSQIRARGGQLVMYGDDTWLKLFPGLFEREDGTTSFFVSDFVEVDNNVTRHIPEELELDDWSAMIMHYLGLDHIGHKAGPRSPNMIPKQQEMDSVVRDIYNAMQEQEHLRSTLLVLCGDHGMNDAGNHGGSSPGETSAALTFISSKFRGMQNGETACPAEDMGDFQFYQTVDQSDIAPTLAGLLRFPVPRNNLGVFIPEILNMWKDGPERLGILLENSRQILSVVKATFPDYEFTDSTSSSDYKCASTAGVAGLECDWQTALRLVDQAYQEPGSTTAAESALLDVSRKAQGIMSSAASNYDLPKLITGSVLSGIAVILSAITSIRAISRSVAPGMFLIFTATGYSIMMFASSYVEEEQQFWYWVFSGWILYLHIKSTSSTLTMATSPGVASAQLAITFRVMRRWNQTGQKFSAEPDIATGFLTQNLYLLWVLVFVTYAGVCQRILRHGPLPTATLSSIWKIISLVICGFAFTFKLSFTQADSPELLKGFPLVVNWANMVRGISLVYQARAVFVGIGVLLILLVYSSTYGAGHKEQKDRKGGVLVFHEILTLVLATQSRAENIPLFLIFRLQEHAISSMNLSNIEITITSLLLEYTTFFAFGGSNAISSVDLSSAYNGISGYNVIAVGVLTFVGNWAGSIWWVSARHFLLRRKSEARKHGYNCDLELLTLFVVVSLLSVMVACSVLRTHLFIWTVFSPKFLYSMAWSIAHHLLVNVGCGKLLSAGGVLR